MSFDEGLPIDMLELVIISLRHSSVDSTVGIL